MLPDIFTHSYHHFPAESPILFKAINRNKPFTLERFISVYRLEVDAKHVSVMAWLGQIIWKSQSSYKEFAPATPSMARRDILHQPQGVYFGFCESYRGQTPPVNYDRVAEDIREQTNKQTNTKRERGTLSLSPLIPWLSICHCHPNTRPR